MCLILSQRNARWAALKTKKKKEEEAGHGWRRWRRWGQGELPIERINRRHSGRGTERRGETIGTQGAVGEERWGERGTERSRQACGRDGAGGGDKCWRR